MSKFIQYNSTLTNVTSFSANFDTRELSARPQFTGNKYTTLNSGFSAIHTVQGYNFDSVTDVLLSCTDSTPLFTSASGLTSVSAFNFATVSGLSATYPEVSGYPTTTYTLNNYNTMEITFPQLSGTGEIDIIAINPAGIGKLSTDIGSAITIN